MEEHGALGIADGSGTSVIIRGVELCQVSPFSSQVAGQVSTSWCKPAAALGQQQALNFVMCCKDRALLPSRHIYSANLIPPEANIVSPFLQKEISNTHTATCLTSHTHNLAELDLESRLSDFPTPAGWTLIILILAFKAIYSPSSATLTSLLTSLPAYNWTIFCNHSSLNAFAVFTFFF